MVRNIDLPEAIVFYGVESLMLPQKKRTNSADEPTLGMSHAEFVLRPGIARLLRECEEDGTTALFIEEADATEEVARAKFESALGKSSNENKASILKLLKNDDPTIHFRCLQSD